MGTTMINQISLPGVEHGFNLYVGTVVDLTMNYDTTMELVMGKYLVRWFIIMYLGVDF